LEIGRFEQHDLAFVAGASHSSDLWHVAWGANL